MFLCKGHTYSRPVEPSGRSARQRTAAASCKGRAPPLCRAVSIKRNYTEILESDVKLLNANLQVKGRRSSPGQVRVWPPLTRPVDSISTKRHLINGLCKWWHNTSPVTFEKRRVTGAEQSPTVKGSCAVRWWRF
jgi:hypothetical protein